MKENAKAKRRRAGDVQLTRAEKWNRSETDLSGTCRRERRDDVRSGGEDDADHILFDQIVSGHDLAQQLLGTRSHLLSRIGFYGGGPSHGAKSGR